MGQEIGQAHFRHRDFERFRHRLDDETQRLHDWIEAGSLSARAPVAGLELEAWLVDADGRPAPHNEALLEALGCPDVVTELGRFNFELNVPPQPVAGDGLARLGDSLAGLWQRCGEAAASLGLRAVAIGILPTVTDADLSLEQLSDRARYRAMNEQVQRQRHGRPVHLDIAGPGGERVHSEHRDVMLEAAATSFQVHLQVPAAQILRVYNASLVASAPLLAACGNSPLLFGRALWQETRVPVFEQALGVATLADGQHEAVPRVGFGSGYAGFSLAECFRENAERFVPLLPIELEEPADRLPHLRLHNGTIWRWNRPIVGFDDDGTPHLRLEHRPLPAGPTLVDMMANLALAIGLIHDLATDDAPPEAGLSFELARANFEAAARSGLQAELVGAVGDGTDRPAGARERLPALVQRARRGLRALQVDDAWADRALGVIGARIEHGQTGAAWQLRRWRELGGDLPRLTLDYAARQAQGRPVHEWR
jgi:gamma-glutamyl:cysteine ligase YbdK (ATP-grasp superfamily)